MWGRGCSHACYKCESCQHEELVQNILGHIEEPKSCTSCNKKWMMKLVHNRSIYLNKQIVKMQVRAPISCQVALTCQFCASPVEWSTLSGNQWRPPH